MYCTLQEAYNIPSFASKKKKGCTNPLNSQSSPIGKISADEYEPYDPYSPGTGKERALTLTLPESQNSQPTNGTVSHKLDPPINPIYAQNYEKIQSQMQQATSANQQYAAINTQPNALWPTRFNETNSKNNVVEHFGQYAKPPPAEQTMNDIPYNVQSGDYKYYCDSFGICTNPRVEGFANAPVQNTSTHSQSVPPSRRYPTQSQQNAQPPGIMFSSNGPPTDGPPGEIQMPYYGPNPMGKCGSIQAPAYELPVSNETKTQSEKILYDAINQQQGASENWPYPMRRVNMANVSGYYDEDLENFLTTQQLKSVPLPPSAMHTNPAVDIDNTYQSTPPQSNLHPENYNPPPSTSNYSEKPKPKLKPIESYNQQNIMDLLLFISLGILIILLCDQIFKLGMSYGMKDTVHILMPYLKDIKIGEV